MALVRTQQTTQDEKKTSPATQASGLIFIEEQKVPDIEVLVNTPPLTLADGLMIMRNPGGIFIIKGEQARYQECKLSPPYDPRQFFKVIPISTTSVGLIFGYNEMRSFTIQNEKVYAPVSYASHIQVIDPRSGNEIDCLRLPVNPQVYAGIISVKTFHRNTHFYAFATRNECWIFDSKKWQLVKTGKNSIHGLIVFHNNDLAIVTSGKQKEIMLEIYQINFKTGTFKLKCKKHQDELIGDELADISETQISPVSNSYFLRNQCLYRIVEDKIIQVFQFFMHSVDWLPDGSLIARTSIGLEQIKINGDKFDIIRLNQKADGLYVFPDGKLLVPQKNKNNLIFEVASVRAAQELASARINPLKIPDEQFLQLLLLILPTLSSSLLKIIVEYSAEETCTQLIKTNELSIPACPDMNPEFRNAIQHYYETLEIDILTTSKNKFHLFDGFEEKVKLKMALEFFIGLLNKNKSVVDSLKEVLATPFKQEMIKIGKKIPRLGVEIAKLISCRLEH